MLKTRQCDLCSDTEFELVGTLDRHARPLETELCLSCGLVSHRNIPTAAELAEFYATRYRREYHAEDTPSARRVFNDWRNAERIHQQLNPWLKPAADVIEIGAGVGCTVKLFERQGHRSTGVEPSAGFQTYAAQQLQAQVARGFLEEIAPEPNYDLALLVHVIEHFRSPREALQHLHCIVRPAGLLYVECPNLGEFATRDKLFHFAHVHNFTPATLEMLAAQCGFELVTWFSHPRDSALQALFRRAAQPNCVIDPGSVAATRAALQRYSTATYYLRWQYLRARLSKLARRVAGHVAATPWERKLVARCAAAKQTSSGGPLPIVEQRTNAA